MNYYAAKGDEYLAQRSGARSDHNQALRASRFSDLTRGTVLDFGCGTGGVISRVPAERRLGIELGQLAAQEARTKGVEVYPSLDDIPAASVDVAISFHAIEHTEHPLTILEGIRRCLKPSGRARLVVPWEHPLGRHRRWKDNPEQHLYTWTPMNFGNLARRAGFNDVSCSIEPVLSAGRGVRVFGKAYRFYLSIRDNSFNVILEAAV